jgi:hypothetical protein
MSRPENRASMGYVRTPPSVAEHVRKLFALPRLGKARVADIGAGDGTPLALFKAGCETIAIEPDLRRYNEYIADRFDYTMQAAHDQISMPRDSISLLWCNPPYSSIDGQRTEYQIFSDIMKTGWVHDLFVLIVKRAILGQWQMHHWMVKVASTVAIFPVTEYEGPDYDQVVFIGRMLPKGRDENGNPLPDYNPNYNEETDLLYKIARAPSRDAIDFWPEMPREGSIQMVAAKVPKMAFHLSPKTYTAEFISEILTKQDPFDDEKWRVLMRAQTVDTERPLMPPNAAQAANYVVAGLMNNAHLANMAVNARMLRTSIATPRDDESIEVNEQFSAELVVLDMGDPQFPIRSLTEHEDIAGFFRDNNNAIVRYIREHFPPLYNMDIREDEQAVLDTILKERVLPGRKNAGLLPLQKHLSVAVARRLFGEYPGEKAQRMDYESLATGTGKTHTSIAVAKLLHAKQLAKGRQKYPFVTVIATMPHLVHKLGDDIADANPDLEVINTYKQVETKTVKFKNGRSKEQNVRHLKAIEVFNAAINNIKADPRPERHVVIMVAGTNLRDGEGWTPSYVIKSTFHDGRERKFAACPTCFTQIHYRPKSKEDDHYPMLAYCIAKGMTPEEAIVDLFNKGKVDWHCHECKGALYQDVRKEGTKPYFPTETNPRPVTYPIASRMKTVRWPDQKKFFDLFILDEAHKANNADAGYTKSALSAGACSRWVLYASATMFNGKASSLMTAATAMSPALRRRFKWTDEDMWIKTFGRKRFIKTPKKEGTRGRAYYRARDLQYNTRDAGELPGVSPALLPYLMANTVFASFRELQAPMPAYEQIVEQIEPGMGRGFEDIWRLYLSHNHQMKEIVKETARAAGKWIQISLSMMNAPWNQYQLTVPELDDEGNYVLDESKKRIDEVLYTIEPMMNANDVSVLLPKEAHLFETVVPEAQMRGVRVGVFIYHINRGIQERIKLIGEAYGYAVGIMPDLDPHKRNAWLKEHAQEYDVLIMQVERVMTGLDLLDFPFLYFWEIPVKLEVFQQAMGRAWRIGQTHDCRTYIPAIRSRELMEGRFLSLVAQKLAAHNYLNGLDDEPVTEMADETLEGALLRRALSDVVNEDDLGEHRQIMRVASTLEWEEAELEAADIAERTSLPEVVEGEARPTVHRRPDPTPERSLERADLAYLRRMREWYLNQPTDTIDFRTAGEDVHAVVNRVSAIRESAPEAFDRLVAALDEEDEQEEVVQRPDDYNPSAFFASVLQEYQDWHAEQEDEDEEFEDEDEEDEGDYGWQEDAEEWIESVEYDEYERESDDAPTSEPEPEPPAKLVLIVNRAFPGLVIIREAA